MGGGEWGERKWNKKTKRGGCVDLAVMKSLCFSRQSLAKAWTVWCMQDYSLLMSNPHSSLARSPWKWGTVGTASVQEEIPSGWTVFSTLNHHSPRQNERKITNQKERYPSLSHKANNTFLLILNKTKKSSTKKAKLTGTQKGGKHGYH